MLGGSPAHPPMISNVIPSIVRRRPIARSPDWCPGRRICLPTGIPTLEGQASHGAARSPPVARLDPTTDRRACRLRGDGGVVIGPGVPRLVVAVGNGREAGRRAHRNAEVVEQVPVAGARYASLAHATEVYHRGGRDLRERAAGRGRVHVLREE